MEGFNATISIIILNMNGLNISIERQMVRLNKEARPNNRNTLNINPKADCF